MSLGYAKLRVSLRTSVSLFILVCREIYNLHYIRLFSQEHRKCRQTDGDQLRDHDEVVNHDNWRYNTYVRECM